MLGWGWRHWLQLGSTQCLDTAEDGESAERVEPTALQPSSQIVRTDFSKVATGDIAAVLAKILSSDQSSSACGTADERDGADEAGVADETGEGGTGRADERADESDAAGEAVEVEIGGLHESASGRPVMSLPWTPPAQVWCGAAQHGDGEGADTSESSANTPSSEVEGVVAEDESAEIDEAANFDNNRTAVDDSSSGLADDTDDETETDVERAAARHLAAFRAAISPPKSPTAVDCLMAM